MALRVRATRPVLERQVFDLVRTLLSANRREDMPAVFGEDDGRVFDRPIEIVRARGGADERSAHPPLKWRPERLLRDHRGCRGADENNRQDANYLLVKVRK